MNVINFTIFKYLTHYSKRLESYYRQFENWKSTWS